MKKNSSEIIFNNANNSYLWDTRNNKYTDFSMSNGALILGHSNKMQLNSLKKNLKNGLNYSNENYSKYEYSKTLLKYFNDFEEVIFSNSGSEANTRAYRICKSLTGKDQFAMISGSWHGSLDPFMFDLVNNKKISLSLGNDSYKDKVNILPHNNISKSLDILNKNKSKISMIIVECVQASFPSEKNITYLKAIYKFAKKNKIMIVFDEIITGMRVSKFAIHKKYKLKPDMVTLGKCFGGGLPVGITLISKEISKKIKKMKNKIFFGGTFSGNPYVTSVGLDTFKYIQKNKKILKLINDKSLKLQKKINSFAVKNNKEFRLIRFESILRPIFTSNNIFGKNERAKYDKDNKKSSSLRNYLLNKKINLPRNGCIFVSYSHTLKDINKLITAIKLFIINHSDDHKF